MGTDTRWNVAYDRPDGSTGYYLAVGVNRETAENYLNNFHNRYVNKPHPNGKGWFPWTNPRVVSWERERANG